MEPHSIDPAHDLISPHHDGVFGPLLWVNTESGEVRKEIYYGDPGGSIKALLVWVGQVVAVVSRGVHESERAKVSRGLRAYLRRGELPIVYERDWLPERAGTLAVADVEGTVPRRDLARAAAYLVVQSEWLERERVAIELDGERFDFDVREAPDGEGRLLTVIK
jgi:hypothetical protein